MRVLSVDYVDVDVVMVTADRELWKKNAWTLGAVILSRAIEGNGMHIDHRMPQKVGTQCQCLIKLDFSSSLDETYEYINALLRGVETTRATIVRSKEWPNLLRIHLSQSISELEEEYILGEISEIHGTWVNRSNELPHESWLFGLYEFGRLLLVTVEPHGDIELVHQKLNNLLNP